MPYHYSLSSGVLGSFLSSLFRDSWFIEIYPYIFCHKNMVAAAQDVTEVLCWRCKEPLPLWSQEPAIEDQDANFIQPPEAPRAITPDAELESDHEMHNPAPVTVVDSYAISPISDLLVILNNDRQQYHYLVNSQALRLVSTVWRTSLDPRSPFRERVRETREVDGRQHIVMELEDDDPEALLAVLNAMHWVKKKVPTSVDFNQLRSFAVLCDKYDCVDVLGEWTQKWLDQWVGVALEPGYEDWLCIAKIFKDGRNVKELEALLVEESGSLSQYRIMAAREKELERQIMIWRNFLRTYIAENAAKGCPNYDCVTLSYGSLIRNIEQSGLTRVLNLTDKWHGNIKDFEARTAGIHLANGTRFHGYGWCAVEQLNMKLRNELGRQSIALDLLEI
ncbi:hypothetical protein ABW19_dt0205864 [Dactylella cylindrospora]|nr:hypothetical protein ABW19_dt0205864 [Dactylella cylindrospora]